MLQNLKKVSDVGIIPCMFFVPEAKPRDTKHIVTSDWTFFGGFSKILSLNFLDHFISQLLIELQSSSKNQKNPHSQFIWGGNTFQSSIYHSFPLKPGCVNKICSIKMLIKSSIFVRFS